MLEGVRGNLLNSYQYSSQDALGLTKNETQLFGDWGESALSDLSNVIVTISAGALSVLTSQV
jgi:hypothetical protein